MPVTWPGDEGVPVGRPTRPRGCGPFGYPQHNGCAENAQHVSARTARRLRVRVGLQAARREVDDGLYRSRWERATPAQRDLLRALADLAGDRTATVSALASRMHKSRASDLSVARNELIKKGLVYAPERGVLAFTVPGMHEFVLRQDGQEID
jgi:hypothetical protein